MYIKFGTVKLIVPVTNTFSSFEATSMGTKLLTTKYAYKDVK